MIAGQIHDVRSWNREEALSGFGKTIMDLYAIDGLNMWNCK